MPAHMKITKNSLLRILRFRRGFTIQTAADQIGLSFLAILRAEQLKPAAVETLAKLATFYGVSLDSVLRNDLSAVEHAPNHEALPSPSQSICQQPTAGFITGLTYCRRKRRLSQKELAEKVGLCTATIVNFERNGFSGKQRSRALLRLSDALGVSVDELLTLHRKEELDAGDRIPLRMSVLNENNPVDRYRMQKNLSLRQLARRLGLTSGQGAHNVCSRTFPEAKYIQKLSDHEGISTVDFLIQYGRPMNTAQEA